MTTASSMCLTRDGGFVFAGEEQKDTNPTSWDILVMKLAPDGLTAPLLSRARLDIATGGARFELSGIVGKTYAAESTADFIVWEPFITNTLLTPQVEIHHPLSFSQRFYRARLLP